MALKIILAGLLILSFTGCAATQKSNRNLQIEQLQTRIYELERELEDKDQDIRDLEEALEVPKSTNYTQAKKTHTPGVTSKNIQRALKNAGFYSGTVDGKIGKNTRKAIKNFQKENGLKADGMVGKRTWEKLAAYLD
ncbi:MAG: peptidoglycan-binding protein [Candidatus Omnitrophica bacterium]|nr:peptidoglycan-binding protein [Candidatus Omnitrophota bacterium]MBU2044328.1 peptidoglycan-binding protein [Candidatus Omnitrophota bacterium]MBU2473715.1 peptidoglycan-binding protein [Candidatus Omnitrophota bacterium]